jgi:hypothetical protein
MSRAAGPNPSTATLLIRAWLHGDPPQVAARLTYTRDLTDPERVSVTVAGEDEISALVRRWLEELAGGVGDGPVTQA